MKILKSIRKNKGYGLILALTFVLIMLILMASTMRWATSDSKATRRNNQFVNSQYAAEAAVENAMAAVNFDFLFGSMTNSAAFAGLTPTNIGNWPIKYVFSNPNINGANNTNIYVNIGNVTANTYDLPAPYSGLKGFYQVCDFAATATPVGQLYNVPATVRETLWATQIPIFQYVIFYNIDLEIDPGGTMPINGNVFCNAQASTNDPHAGIWEGSTYLQFNGLVQSVGTNTIGGTDPFAYKTKTDSGTASIFKQKGEPEYNVSPVTIPVAGVNNTNNDPAVVHKILEWPPASYALGTADAYTTNGLTYLANEAGLIISNAISGTNWDWDGSTPPMTNKFISVYYQDSTYLPSKLNSNTNNLANSIIWATNDFYIIQIAATNLTSKKFYTNYYYFTNYIGYTSNGTYIGSFTNYGSHTNIDVIGSSNSTNKFGPGGTNYLLHTSLVYAGYSFVTNVLFYDWREGGTTGKAKPVQAVQFDVGAYNTWLTNKAANGGYYYNHLSQAHWDHSIGGIYVYTSVTNTLTSLPAVKVVDGSKLFDSYGLTIATQFPLYVQADYNVTDGSGSDAGKNTTGNTYPSAFLADSVTVLSASWTDSTTSEDPVPSTSVGTINAACLEGIVPSSTTISANDGYSGGVENFLRLLENWGSKKLYYNGSIVVMFPSEYSTNRWNGSYYGVPTREWAFDTNFNAQLRLPPMTPNVKTVIRTTWSGH